MTTGSPVDGHQHQLGGRLQTKVELELLRLHHSQTRCSAHYSFRLSEHLHSLFFGSQLRTLDRSAPSAASWLGSAAPAPVSTLHWTFAARHDAPHARLNAPMHLLAAFLTAVEAQLIHYQPATPDCHHHSSDRPSLATQLSASACSAASLRSAAPAQRAIRPWTAA